MLKYEMFLAPEEIFQSFNQEHIQTPPQREGVVREDLYERLKD